MISNNFIHSCQLGRLKYRSTTDVGIALTYFIQSGWVKNLTMSMLAFDITQFFSLLNHWLLLLILDKTGFVSYASPHIQKLHLHSDIISKLYKLTFHSRNTPIQLSLLWQSYLCQCLNTETFTQGNKGFTTETPSISYNICLYIRLVVTL